PLAGARPRPGGDRGDRFQRVLAGDDPSQDVELGSEDPGVFADDDEELAAGGVAAVVGHRHDPRLVHEVVAGPFVGDAVAGPAGADGLGVAALDHEVRDDAVEHGAVVEALAGEEHERLDRLRVVGGGELDDDVAARRGDGGNDDGDGGDVGQGIVAGE